MATFEELFDEVFEKAKFAAGAASKKTNEIVEIGKLKYKAKQISWEIERTYSKLGVLVYEAKKSGGEFEAVIDAAVEEIDSLNKRLDELEEKIRSYRKVETKHSVADEEAPEEVIVEYSDIIAEDNNEE